MMMNSILSVIYDGFPVQTAALNMDMSQSLVLIL